MEIEDLLRRASMAPLGPLALTYVSSDDDTWALTVTLSGKRMPMRALRDTATGGLILTCTVGDASSAVVGGWVTDTNIDEASGRTIRRLWLHGDGLSSALLLNALAALAQTAVSEEPAVVQQIIVIPPPPKEPDPVPLERPKPVGWNSFGFGRRDPEPEEEPAVASASPEAGAEPQPEPQTAAVETSVPAEVANEPAAGPEPEPILAVPKPSQPQATAAIETVEPAGKSGYCRECGSPYTPEHAFCTNCGARLN